MRTINREDVVQAALTVERWCAGKDCRECPLVGIFGQCLLVGLPEMWMLEDKLRNKGRALSGN